MNLVVIPIGHVTVSGSSRNLTGSALVAAFASEKCIPIVGYAHSYQFTELDLPNSIRDNKLGELLHNETPFLVTL